MQARSTKAVGGDSDIDTMSACEEEFAPKPKVGSRSTISTQIYQTKLCCVLALTLWIVSLHIHWLSVWWVASVTFAYSYLLYTHAVCNFDLLAL